MIENELSINSRDDLVDCVYLYNKSNQWYNEKYKTYFIYRIKANLMNGQLIGKENI